MPSALWPRGLQQAGAEVGGRLPPEGPRAAGRQTWGCKETEQAQQAGQADGYQTGSRWTGNHIRRQTGGEAGRQTGTQAHKQRLKAGLERSMLVFHVLTLTTRTQDSGALPQGKILFTRVNISQSRGSPTESTSPGIETYCVKIPHGAVSTPPNSPLAASSPNLSPLRSSSADRSGEQGTVPWMRPARAHRSDPLQ